MNLYRVLFDGQEFYVEAESFAVAVSLWTGHVRDIWGSDFDGTEQPESVQLMHDEPVIRAKGA